MKQGRLTPSGRKWPQKMSPPAWTLRGAGPGIGENILSASSNTADKYLSFWTLSRLISFSDANADRTSVASLLMASGLVHRRYVAPANAVAVVSEPAIISKLAF